MNGIEYGKFYELPSGETGIVLINSENYDHRVPDGWVFTQVIDFNFESGEQVEVHVFEKQRLKEPMGIGAVVQNIHGATYVRTPDLSGKHWLSEWGVRQSWDTLHRVAHKVLSEGVKL